MSPRETFNRELNRLRDDLLLLGSMTEKAIVRSIDAFKKRDLEAAREVANHTLLDVPPLGTP